MKPKQILRMGIDMAMTILVLVQMAYLHTGQMVHEWLGAVLLVLIAAHLSLNQAWIKNWKRGRYTPFRIVQSTLVLLTLAAMAGAMLSGIWMSQYAFGFLPVHGGMAWARTAHMLCVYWGFLFVSTHLGLHWRMILGMLREAAGLSGRSTLRTAGCRLAALGIVCYGLYAFSEQRLADYLFLRSQFVFFDFESSIGQFVGQYAAVMGLAACCTFYLGQLVTRLAGRSLSTQQKKEQEQLI